MTRTPARPVDDWLADQGHQPPSTSPLTTPSSPLPVNGVSDVIEGTGRFSSAIGRVTDNRSVISRRGVSSRSSRTAGSAQIRIARVAKADALQASLNDKLIADFRGQPPHTPQRHVAEIFLAINSASGQGHRRRGPGPPHPLLAEPRSQPPPKSARGHGSRLEDGAGRGETPRTPRFPEGTPSQFPGDRHREQRRHGARRRTEGSLPVLHEDLPGSCVCHRDLRRRPWSRIRSWRPVEVLLRLSTSSSSSAGASSPVTGWRTS